jgi:LysR family transcriptional activator of glutamate synthase operon
MAGWFVPDLLRHFHVTAPHVRFDLCQAGGREIADHLADGRVDLAITAPRPEGTDFRWHQLYVERLCLVVPIGHRFAKRAKLRLAEAADEPFIAMDNRFGLRQLTDELLSEEGIDPQVFFEATEIPMMEGLVAAGFGVGVAPVPRAQRADPIAVYVPLSNPRARRHVGLAWVHARTLSPVAERFSAFVRAGD